MRKTWPIVILLLLISSFSNPIYASSNTMQDLTMKIHVNADGSADITERWDMTMRDGTENYKVFNKMGDSAITQFRVTDEKGSYQEMDPWDVEASRGEKTNKYGIVKKSDGYELCFGIGSYGSRVYTMSYTITNFVDQYKDKQAIHWYLLDPKFSFKPKTFSATITSDIDLVKSVSEIHSYGFKGTHNLTKEGIIKLTNVNKNKTGKVNNINVFIGFKGNYFTNTNHQYSNKTYKQMEKLAEKGSDIDYTVLYAILAIILFVFIYFVIYYYVRRLVFEDGIKLPKKKEINYFRDIPCEGNIYRFYYLIKKLCLIQKNDLENGVLSAIILQWMKKGNITLKKASRGNKYEIELHPDVSLPSTLEKQLFSYFMQASSTTTHIVTQRGFKSWCKANYKKLDTWFTKVDNAVGQQLIEDGKCRNGDQKILKTPIYAASVREEMIRVLGFRKFLKEFSRMAEKTTNEVHLWENYLIFALPLGQADKVEKEIGNLYPEFYEESTLPDLSISIVAFSNVFITQSRPSRTSGSSSFGGGSGGSHGGGGGGSR